MQIGEFAKLCETKISVLRHYDKLGLLPPAYTDPMTGYRHYTAEQAAVFLRIQALKQAGFSLADIRAILHTLPDDNALLRRFDEKETELLRTLDNLRSARRKILKGKTTMKLYFEEKNGILTAMSDPFDAEETRERMDIADKLLRSEDYQRISGFRSYGEASSNEVRLGCDVVKLTETMTVSLNDDIDGIFENDPSVVGKWQIVGLYAVRDDFYAGRGKDNRWYGESMREIYFLPGGEKYWVYHWSKGVLYRQNGDGTAANPYEIADYNGERYLFLAWKTTNYRRGGHPETLVLRQLDSRAYTKEEIRRRDDVNLPFIDDVRVLGAWRAHSTFRSREQFDPSGICAGAFWSGIDFAENGSLTMTVGGREVANTWTNGVVLDRRQSLAMAYEIEVVDGKDYLIVEWKNGDHIYGGFVPGYYAFVR